MPKVTFAQLKQAPPQAKRISMDIEEWGGGTFHLDQFSGVAYEEVLDRLRTEFGEDWSTKGSSRMMAIILSRCLVDDDGKSPDEQWLMEQPITLLNRLSQEALKLNGLTPATSEVLEKN